MNPDRFVGKRTLHLVADRPTESPQEGTGRGGLSVISGGGSVDALIDGWKLAMRRRGVIASSITKRSGQVATFSRWLDEIPLLEACADEIEEFLDSRRAKGSAAPVAMGTRYNYLSALGCFYDWAIVQGLAEHNPVDIIDRPKVRKGLPRPIPDDDLAFALANSTGQMRLWLLLGAYAGLRCAEIADLHRDNLNYDLGMLRIMGKGHKERMVPMHSVIEDALRAYPMPAGNSYVFRRPTSGTRWRAGDVSITGAAHLRGIGVEATMHQLRHWFGTRTLQACGNLRTVQELMGHASITTTAIYTAFCNEDGRAAVAKLDDTLARRRIEPASHPELVDPDSAVA